MVAESIGATRAPVATPFVKWAGGKRRLYPVIRQHFPRRFHRYWEPCLGGGAVFFSARPFEARLSDINEELITAYRAIRDRVEDVILELRALEPATQEHYYAVRGWSWRSMSCARACARLLFLNRNGFNGLYRVNREGKFNVPYGGGARPIEPDALRACSAALRHADIVAASVFDVLEAAKPGDFVYVDPPYVPRSRTAAFTSYSRSPFGEPEQRRLSSPQTPTRLWFGSSTTASLSLSAKPVEASTARVRDEGRLKKYSYEATEACPSACSVAINGSGNAT